MLNETLINPNLNKLHLLFQNEIAKYLDGDEIKKEYSEIVECYNCKSTEIANSFIINNFRHVRCKKCGLVYVNPRLKEQIAHNLYSEKFYEESYKLKIIPSIDYRKNILAANKFNQINKYFPKTGKVLDIGCGCGEVLSIFQEKGWDCLGVEFNEFASNYARDNFDLKVINNSIYEFNSLEKYDLIMMWGVLEHFFDPIKVLNKVYDILDDRGLLVLEVPSSDSVLVRYYEFNSKYVDRIIEGDRHIMLFSLQSFKEMTLKTGFHPINILSNGLDIATLNRLELNNLLNLDSINQIQELIDKSYQGDLLRGFFKKNV